MLTRSRLFRRCPSLRRVLLSFTVCGIYHQINSMQNWPNRHSRLSAKPRNRKARTAGLPKLWPRISMMKLSLLLPLNASAPPTALCSKIQFITESLIVSVIFLMILSVKSQLLFWPEFQNSKNLYAGIFNACAIRRSVVNDIGLYIPAASICPI